MTHLKRVFALSTICALSVADGIAQTYPVRSVRVVVPYAPGGGSDILGRILAAKVSDDLGQQFIIDNRAGGNATIGSQMVARATPDGYTIGVLDTALAINPGLFAKLPYDALKDFMPITLIATSPLVLVVHPSVPVKTTKELIALAKARPGQLTFSSGGAGTGTHLSTELFKSVTGMDVIHVPYKGAGPAMTAMLSGEVGMNFSLPASIPPHIRAGRARALAITGANRFPGLPEVPTLTETGVTGVNADPWWGMFAPAGTPQPIISRLHEVFVKHITAPDMSKRMIDMAFVTAVNTPAEFSAYLRTDIQKWGKVIKEAGIQVQ